MNLPGVNHSALASFLPLAAIATTPAAVRTLQPLLQVGVTLWVAPGLEVPGAQVYEGSLRTWLAAHWSQYRGFVFGLATGAAVRLVAPLLDDKRTDPPAIAVGNGVAIALLGAHGGGGEQLVRAVAQLLDVTAIATGAAAAAAIPGTDQLGDPFGWRRGAGDWTAAAAAAARGTARVRQAAGSTLWQQHLPDGHPFVWVEDAGEPVDLSIDVKRGNATACWHPRLLWVGVGCERGTPRSLVERTLSAALAQQGLAAEAIAGLASLDLKADEAGLLELSAARDWPLRTFAPEQLQAIAVPNPSAVVAAAVGTPSVAEAAALAAAGPEADLLVPKQVAKDETGAVTVAIARARVEFTGREGRLLLAGIGPGALAQMTPAVRAALQQVDAIVGYALYLEAIAPLRRPGQIVEGFPIGAERQRAERAIALAEWGLTVAVVSSGDAGIYGMGGVVLEVLRDRGWDGHAPGVEVLPGISALQAAAARAGTPLMHDFCAISLSDLLTPWEVIERRLVAAARADFVVALYNPKSRDRVRPFAAACEIFLQHRAPDTPVVVVRNAFRPGEQIARTYLRDLATTAVDMLGTVLIGNSNTRFYGDWMLTPRGYLGFE